MKTNSSNPRCLVLVIPWLAWAVALFLLSQALGPYLHESDQASLLTGAWELAHGLASMIGAPFYNYDKQYGAYWCVALGLRALPGADPVGLGNVMSLGFFWPALGFFLWRQPARTWVQAGCVAACLLAPTLLQHSAFLASNYFSAAFVLLAAGQRAGGPVWLTALCFGAGVACRADALFVLPALAWWRSSRRGPLAFLQDPAVIALAGSGLVALLAGRCLAAEASRSVYTLFFYPKIYLAFVVFGLGATVFVAAGWGAATLVAWRRSRGRHPVFYLLGGLTLLPALAYYTVQMFSTRHWTVWVAGLVILVSGRRSAVLLGGLPRRVSALLVAACLAGAGLPLIVGLHLPRPSAPRLVLAAGTRFPSADGNLTMGGYALALRQVDRRAGLVDHNQAVWLAASHVAYAAGPDGRVTVVDTPMASYYELALTLRGQSARQVAAPEAGAYLDSRSWLRPAARLDEGEVEEVGSGGPRAVPRPVSPAYAGVRMLCFAAGAALGADEARDQFLKALFHGNEFVRLAAATDWRGREFEGRRLVWFAPAAFALEVRDPPGPGKILPAQVQGDFYFVALSGDQRRGATVRVLAAGGGVAPQLAAGVLMDYMRLDAIVRPRPAGSSGQPDGSQR